MGEGLDAWVAALAAARHGHFFTSANSAPIALASSRTSSVAMLQMMSRLTAGYSCRRMLPMAAISRQGTSGWRAFIAAGTRREASEMISMLRSMA